MTPKKQQRTTEPQSLNDLTLPAREPFKIGDVKIIEDRNLVGTETEVKIFASPEMYDTLIEAKALGLSDVLRRKG